MRSGICQHILKILLTQCGNCTISLKRSQPFSLFSSALICLWLAWFGRFELCLLLQLTVLSQILMSELACFDRLVAHWCLSYCSLLPSELVTAGRFCGELLLHWSLCVAVIDLIIVPVGSSELSSGLAEVSLRSKMPFGNGLMLYSSWMGRFHLCAIQEKLKRLMCSIESATSYPVLRFSLVIAEW